MPNVPNNTLQTVGVRSGVSRNDGTNGYGTRSLPSQIIVNTTTGLTSNVDNLPTQEAPDSPTIERAEQCTVVHRYTGSYNNCLALCGIYGRGVLITDDVGNYYRVLSSTAQYGGGTGAHSTLTITSLSISFDVPPDEFHITPVNLGLDILKHPRYLFAITPSGQIPNYPFAPDTPAQMSAKQVIYRALQAYRENPFIPTSANINGMSGLLHDNITANFVSGKFPYAVNNPNYTSAFPSTDAPPINTTFAGGLPYPPTAASSTAANPVYYWKNWNGINDPEDVNGKVALALAAGMELIGKFWRQEDAPPVMGIEMEWTEYSYVQPPLNLGGTVEDPIGINTPANVPQSELLIPDYFYSTEFPADPAFTIFDKLSVYNPQVYGITGQYNSGTRISWLRDANIHELLNGVLWRITRKWKGAFVGAWDQDINGGARDLNGPNRPTLPSHYRPLLLQ